MVSCWHQHPWHDQNCLSYYHPPLPHYPSGAIHFLVFDCWLVLHPELGCILQNLVCDGVRRCHGCHLVVVMVFMVAIVLAVVTI